MHQRPGPAVENSAAMALTWTRAVMAKLGLTLNEAKTSVKDVRTESFDFLGYSLGPRHYPDSGRRYLGASPSKKSVQRIKAKVSGVLTPGNKGALPDVRTRLNRLLGGWSAYFSYGSHSSAYQAVDDHVYDRVRSFLCKRHKEPGRGTKRFSREYVYAELGVLRLRRGRQMPPALCPTMKPVGKPDAGNPHVRFDERRLETELWRELRHRHGRKPPANSTPRSLRPPRQSSTLQLMPSCSSNRPTDARLSFIRHRFQINSAIISRVHKAN